MNKGGTVYIMSSPDKTALYTGVTSDLPKRVWQHREKAVPTSFTAQYNCTVLVYYNHFETIESAIAEEKRIKGGSRAKKIQLIESMNKDWKDLSSDLM
jgi:putative endonuclease